MSHYKFVEPEVLAAFKARREAINALNNKARVFALQFAPEAKSCCKSGAMVFQESKSASMGSL